MLGWIGSARPLDGSLQSWTRCSMTIPNVLTIAGVDPSGGAGVAADLKSFAAHGAYGCAVVTALTAQNTRAIAGIVAVDPGFVSLQIRTLLADVRIASIKTGMLGTASVVRAVAESLTGFLTDSSAAPLTDSRVHLVIDPVMAAKTGDALLKHEATAMLIEALLPLATVLTPNLPEAGVLLRERPPETVREMRRAAERLRRMMSDAGERWVLVKGGHLPDSEPALDLLHDGDRMIELAGPRLVSRNTHGTGCSLSAAIAALAVQRPDLPSAVREAKTWLAQAIAHADQLSVGQGHGPVHHLHRLWRSAPR
jgi:hydroxymethylpyrimidine/phosphomethylpyrimidine kinase